MKELAENIEQEKALKDVAKALKDVANVMTKEKGKAAEFAKKKSRSSKKA